jgi:hypothetical protein
LILSKHLNLSEYNLGQIPLFRRQNQLLLVLQIKSTHI